MSLVPRGTAARRFLLAAGIALLLAAVWAPCLLEQSRDVDVLLYSAAAMRANAHGALPYEAAWIEKGPLAMGLYQVLFLVFGPGNIAAIAGAWFALALAGTALAWALAALAARCAAGGPAAASSAGPWAGALFAVSLGAVGGTLNTEIPAAVAAAAAVLVWMRTARGGGALARGGLAAGALAGAACLCRQNAGAVWPLLVASEGLLVFARGRSAREAGRSALAISAGFLAVIAAVAGLYAARGTFGDMLFCVYGYNASIYIAATKVDAARLFAVPLVIARSFLLPVWTTSALGLAGIGMAARHMREARRGPAASGTVGRDGGSAPRGAPGTASIGLALDRVLLPVLALVAVGLTASLVPGLRLFSHYFAMALPFWAALGGAAIARLAGGRRASRGRQGQDAAAAMGSLGPGRDLGAERRDPVEGQQLRRDPTSTIAPVGGTLRASPRALAVGAIVLVSLGAELSQRPWTATARAVRAWIAGGGLSHPGDPLAWPGHDPLAAKAARWLREHSAPEDTVFVWGMRPHVPVYARRAPATRFTTCTFLTGLVPWERVGSEEDTARWIVPGAWDILARELDAERPRFIVDASQDHLFASGAYPPSKFPPLQERLASRYAPAFDTGADGSGAGGDPRDDRLVIWMRNPD